MKHYGDITKLNGAELPAVDVIIGGSPCQDLSVAGKRAGLAGERSGLFMEQIRVIKEMRQHDRDCGRTGVHVRPRYMVWENVPGAFSSNSGEDFRAVLEETAHIADKNAVVPKPPNGKWTTSGAIVGDGWSIAWRVFDAQFWGVPQRRRRIALVADFGGQSAPEILFIRNGLSWDTSESGEAGQGTAGDFEDGAGATGGVKCLNPWDTQSGRCYSADGVWHSLNANENGGQSRDSVCYPHMSYGFKLGNSEQARSIGFQEERSPTLNAECGGNKPAICYGICSDASNSMKSTNPHSGIYVAETSRTLDLNGGNPACNQGGICVAQCYDMTHATDVIRECGETAPTLQSRMGTGGNQIPLTFCIGNGQAHIANHITEEVSQTLNCMHDPMAVMTKTAPLLTGCPYADRGDGDGGLVCSKGNMQQYAVRRLTPLECERLQGYTDGWTDIGEWTDSKGKVHKPSDSARYKALGNSIALPPWRWVLLRITAQYERPATLGSLFDGIGGFPLIWERLNGDGACLWASEIEEFCIAVTRMRFERTVQT